jgi:hypothetical protein
MHEIDLDPGPHAIQSIVRVGEERKTRWFSVLLEIFRIVLGMLKAVPFEYRQARVLDWLLAGCEQHGQNADTDREHRAAEVWFTER